jgi:hypothetical protein
MRTLYEGSQTRPKRCYVLVDENVLGESGIISCHTPIDEGATYSVIEGQLVLDERGDL